MGDTIPDWKYWLNWALLAVFGRMDLADQIMRAHGPKVSHAASQLASRHRTPRRKLHRGLVIDRSEVSQDIKHIEELTFMSFSENQEVAIWFAHPQSGMSELIASQKDDPVGVVVEYTPMPSEILFHHSWIPLKDWTAMASLHPAVTDPRQLLWNLKTQSEVILKPIHSKLKARLVDDIWSGDIKALDKKFMPPFLEN